jgi:hypothetical protein
MPPFKANPPPVENQTTIHKRLFHGAQKNITGFQTGQLSQITDVEFLQKFSFILRENPNQRRF